MSYVYWEYLDEEGGKLGEGSGVCYAYVFRENAVQEGVKHIRLFWPEKKLYRIKDEDWWKFLNTVPFYKPFVENMDMEQYNKHGVLLDATKYSSWHLFMACVLFRYIEEFSTIVDRYVKIRKHEDFNTFTAFYLAHKGYKQEAYGKTGYLNDNHCYFTNTGGKYKTPIPTLKWEMIMKKFPNDKPYIKNPKVNMSMNETWDSLIREGM